MTDDNDRLERILRGFEDAVIDAAEDELGAPNEGTAKTISAALRVYGFNSDGSRVRTSWKRVRRGRPHAVVRSPVAGAVSDAPLRATFSGKQHDDDDDDPEGQKS